MIVGGVTSHQQHYKKLNLKRKVFLVRRRPRLRQHSLTPHSHLEVFTLLNQSLPDLIRSTVYQTREQLVSDASTWQTFVETSA